MIRIAGVHVRSLFLLQRPVRLDVANDIVREFLVPEFRIALGLACKLAAVLVPKTAVYKDNHAVLENEQIRRAG